MVERLDSEEAREVLYTYLKELGMPYPDAVLFGTGWNPIDLCFQFDTDCGDLELLKSHVNIPGLDDARRIIFKVPHNPAKCRNITYSIEKE